MFGKETRGPIGGEMVQLLRCKCWWCEDDGGAGDD